MVRPTINFSSVRAIADKEFSDNLRSRWVQALTIIFILLTILSSYLVGGQTGGDAVFGGVEDTVMTLMSISMILVPLIAIMLGYATVSGEIESGALAIVLSYPVRREEVLLGKFIGLAVVLAFSIVVGFGLSGLIIAATAGTASFGAYLAFIGYTLLLGVIYFSLSLMFSTIMKTRTTSLGAGIFVFFWSMIYGTIVFGIYLGTGGSFESLISGTVALPDWFWWAMLLSPMDSSQVAIMQVFGLEQAFGYAMEIPSFVSVEVITAALLLWFIIPALISFVFFNRRDL